jgi:phage repressor protein C with HTH and peptisase S24 domain
MESETQMRHTSINRQIADMFGQARQSLQKAREHDSQASQAASPQEAARFNLLAKQARQEKQTWLDTIKQTAKRYTEPSFEEISRQLDQQSADMFARQTTRPVRPR